MLFVHETHSVRGACEDDFESAYRDEYLPAVARSGDARLAWYLDHAHGSGRSYRVVTVTAVRDAAAWERHAARLDGGDLTGWQARIDGLRHEVEGKVLVPLPWSPLQQVDLEALPVTAATGTMSLYMEDTVWPYAGRLADYIDRSGSHYAPSIEASSAAGTAILEVQAAFRSAWGTHRRNEIVLWQRVVRDDFLLALLRARVPEQHKAPGSWMHDALDLRDQWESRLLRTAPWSPLPDRTPA
jgi:hypothetical protein